MSTTTIARPEATQVATPDAGGAQPAGRRSPLVRPYLGYVGYFVGAGLISGGIVHYPLDRSFYAVVAAAGVALFLAATVLNEIVLRTDKVSLPQAARIIGASLLLSIGIGMLSGGIQHFTDFPVRAAVLVPAGLVLSFAAYMVRQGTRGQHKRLLVAAGAVVAIAAAASVGLSALADELTEEGENGHSHSEPVSEIEEKPATDTTVEHAEVVSHTTEESANEEAPASDTHDPAESHNSGHAH